MVHPIHSFTIIQNGALQPYTTALVMYFTPVQWSQQLIVITEHLCALKVKFLHGEEEDSYYSIHNFSRLKNEQILVR